MSARAAIRRQRGFTLFELMAAVTISTAVLAPAMALMFAAMEWSTQSASQIRLNQQARLIQGALIDGMATTSAGKDGVNYAYGLRGREDAFSGKWSKGYMLRYRSNNIWVEGDTFTKMTVSCTDVADPLPACSGPGAQQVDGYLALEPEVEDKDRSVDGRTVEVTLTIVDPFEAQRLENPREVTETYRLIATMMRDENDP